MQEILDKKLVDKVKSIVVSSEAHDVESIRDLLGSGANPNSVLPGEEFSAYEIIKANNPSGEFNAIIEEFDEHLVNDLREADSIDEGMHLTDEEK